MTESNELRYLGGVWVTLRACLDNNLNKMQMMDFLEAVERRFEDSELVLLRQGYDRNRPTWEENMPPHFVKLMREPCPCELCNQPESFEEASPYFDPDAFDPNLSYRPEENLL